MSEHSHEPDTAETSAEPCCAKCESTLIGSTRRSWQGVEGLLIFCTACGAIITWAPVPKK
jgi:hypothetical protein